MREFAVYFLVVSVAPTINRTIDIHVRRARGERTHHCDRKQINSVLSADTDDDSTYASHPEN